MNEVDYLLKNSSLSSKEKLEIIRLGPHQPKDIQISQQDGKIIRKFGVSWFTKTSWITVSEEKKAFFCFICILFGGEPSWTCSGIKDIKHISERIRSHELTATHINNTVYFKTFGKGKVISTTDSGHHQSVARHNELVDKNRHVLSRIIDCIKFCGIHESPLCGHDETVQLNNREVFLDLVEWAASLDNILDDHLKNSKVAKCTSKTIQNDLLDCMYDVYIDEIKSEMKQTSFVSVLADETTDVACCSEFVITLRYLVNSWPVERFLAFVNVDDRTPCELTKILQNKLSPFDLTDKLIAQSYNGAPEILSSTNNEVPIKMRETYPHAHYLHCSTHRLDFVLKKACSSINRIKLFFASISGIGAFFNSPKRNSLLRKICKSRVLKTCETQWNFTSEIINCIRENREDLMKCFEIIQQEDGWDDKSIWEATGFMKCLREDEFNFFLTFFYVVFTQVDILQNILQTTKYSDLFTTRAFRNFDRAIDRIMEALKDFRESVVDDTTKRPKMELNSMSNYNNINNAFEIYAEEACIVIKGEMLNRFGNSEIFKSFLVVDPKLYKIYQKKIPIGLINVLKTNYPMLKIDKLKSELMVLYNNNLFHKFENINELCKFIIDSDLKDTLSEVSKLLEIILVTPVSTVDAKNSVDMLKKIKTHIKNTFSHDRLNALAVLSIHKDFIQHISCFNKKVIEKFATMNDTRAEYLYK